MSESEKRYGIVAENGKALFAVDLLLQALEQTASCDEVTALISRVYSDKVSQELMVDIKRFHEGWSAKDTLLNGLSLHVGQFVSDNINDEAMKDKIVGQLVVPLAAFLAAMGTIKVGGTRQ